jgi:hypothetical protein
VAKFHYWTSVSQLDDSESSLSTVDPLITLAPAARRVDDTILRVIFWCQVMATFGPTSLPPHDWLEAATCDYLVWFDQGSSGIRVNLTDDELETMGFVRMQQRMWLSNTANVYTVMWQGPTQGVSLQGSHKGKDPFTVPSVSFQRWVADNSGTFDNFAGRPCTFSSRLIGRLLWASDQGP